MAEMTRRAFNLLTSGAVLASSTALRSLSLSPQSARDAVRQQNFPYCTHIYREPHLPLEQLRHDLPLLKRLGFTMVKIQEVWGYDESVEGEIDLSNVEQVIADARQNELLVYFGITMENPPMWLWRRYPDATMVYETGQPHSDPTPYVLPSDGKPGPCWHHPHTRAAAERFVEAVGRQLGRYENIAQWNVFQEIGLWPQRPGHLGLCYCAYTLAAFRKWLRTRYSSLRDLNQTWRSAYGDWEEVAPPRSSPKVPPTIDWRYFMDNVYLSESLQWKGDALRRSDPGHRPIMAHVGGITAGSTREWRYSEQLDTFGTSCYPGWSGPQEWDAGHGSPGSPVPDEVQSRFEVEDLLMRFDYVRSAKKDGVVWAAELQGGPITEGLNRRRVPNAGDIRRWVLTCMAGGARGISFWNHRPEMFWEEGYGFSLLDWGSDTSERAEEAGRLGRALDQHADLFTVGESPKAQVAIVLNEDLYHWAEGSQHDVLQHLQYSVTGIWKTLARRGYAVDFIESAAVASSGAQYRALIFPFPLALSSETCASLREYARSGGILISEACPGRFSNYGIGNLEAMGEGLPELFGAHHLEVALIREPDKGMRWTNWERSERDALDYALVQGVGEMTGLRLAPAYYLQTLRPDRGVAIFSYKDQVAGVVNTYGNGRAYLLGTMIGHAGPAFDDWRNGAVLARLLEKNGVVGKQVEGLQVRQRVHESGTAWFFVNISDAATRYSLHLGEKQEARDLLGGKLSASAGVVDVAVDPAEVRCVLVKG